MESPLLPASVESASPPSAALMHSAYGAVRLRVILQLGAGEGQESQLVGWPAGTSAEVVELHLRRVLQLSHEQEIVLRSQGSAQENCAPLRLHDLLSISTNEPLDVSHDLGTRALPMRPTLLSQEEASFGKSRLLSSTVIEIEAAIDDLSFLDTQTTYLAVERALLATIRLIISIMNSSAEALHDDSHIEDHREMLKILAPCLVGMLWVLYMIDVVCWVSYFKVIGAGLKEMRQYFSIEGQEKLASSWTCLISGAIVVAATIAYSLFIFVPDIDSS